MEREAFVIENITEYGKLMAFCINRGFYTGNATWNIGKDSKDGFYILDWTSKCLWFADSVYSEDVENGYYKISTPVFSVNKYDRSLGYYIEKRIEHQI